MDLWLYYICGKKERNVERSVYSTHEFASQANGTPRIAALCFPCGWLMEQQARIGRQDPRGGAESRADGAHDRRNILIKLRRGRRELSVAVESHDRVHCLHTPLQPPPLFRPPSAISELAFEIRDALMPLCGVIYRRNSVNRKFHGEAPK